MENQVLRVSLKPKPKGFRRPHPTLREVQVQTIREALIRNQFCRVGAAEDLGIAIKTVTQWIQRCPELEEFRIKKGEVPKGSLAARYPY